MNWILIIYLFSAGIFLFLFLILSVVKDGNNLMKIHPVSIFKTALTPIINSLLCVMCFACILLSFYERIKIYFISRKVDKELDDLIEFMKKNK